MTRRVTLPILAILAAAACGRKGARSADFDSATSAALSSGPASAPAADQAKVVRIAGFVLAHQLDAHQQPVGGPVQQFAPGDSIMLSVNVQYASGPADLSARLRQNQHTVDSAGVKVGAADTTGMSIVGLSFASAKGWSKGDYQADIFLNGKFQMSQEFTVGQ